jgi:hypothetical protein
LKYHVFRAIHKIVDSRVIECLQKYPNANGIVAYLQLIAKVLRAYVDKGVSLAERIQCGVFAVVFLRLWRAELVAKEGSNASKYFITSNSWHGLELDLMLLLRLAVEGKADNIEQLSSQKNEDFFREFRSYTTVESTVVNASMKTFAERVQKIVFVEDFMHDLQNELEFPKLKSREDRSGSDATTMTQSVIFENLLIGIKQAEDKVTELGMTIRQYNLKDFFHPVRNLTTEPADQPGSIQDEDSEEEADFLGINSQPMTVDDTTEDPLTINNLEFSNELSRK